MHNLLMLTRPRHWHGITVLMNDLERVITTAALIDVHCEAGQEYRRVARLERQMGRLRVEVDRKISELTVWQLQAGLERRKQHQRQLQLQEKGKAL